MSKEGGSRNFERTKKETVLFTPGFGKYPDIAFKGLQDTLRKKFDHDLIFLEHIFPNKGVTARRKRQKALSSNFEKISAQTREIATGSVAPEKMEKLLSKIPLSIFGNIENLIREAELHKENSGVATSVVGHSQGALTATLAAFLRPDLFEKVILMNPLGFTGKIDHEHEHSKLIAGSEKLKKDRESKAREIWGANYKRTANLVWRYIIGSLPEAGVSKDPGIKGITDYIFQKGLALFREVHDIANIDIAPYVDTLVNDLHKNVAVLYDDADRIFPAEKVVPRIPNTATRIKTQEGGHLGSIKNPEHYAERIHNVLMNKNKLLVAPGFGETNKGAFGRLRVSLGNRGYDVRGFEHATPGRGGELKKELAHAREKVLKENNGRVDEKELKILLDRIPISLYREAKDFIEYTEQSIRNGERVHALGHSQGGFYITIAALLRPDLFQKLILVNPAGFTGKKEYEQQSESLRISERLKRKCQKRVSRQIHLMSRYAAGLCTELLSWRDKKSMAGATRDSFAYMWKRPGQMFSEASGMANTDIVPYIKILQKYGIEFTVVYDDSDKVFLADTLKERIPEGVTVIETENKGHFGPVKDPEYFADLVSEVLGKQENSNSRPQAAE